MRDVPLECGAAALQTGERDAGAGRGADHGISARRAYQLYCENLTPAGAGDLHVAFEQLKAKLLAEGLFDRSLKKPLPPYPHTIGIITSGAGAAIVDMLRILNKRYPLAKVKILPVRVQGAERPRRRSRARSATPTRTR